MSPLIHTEPQVLNFCSWLSGNWCSPPLSVDHSGRSQQQISHSTALRPVQTPCSTGVNTSTSIGKRCMLVSPGHAWPIRPAVCAIHRQHVYHQRCLQQQATSRRSVLMLHHNDAYCCLLLQSRPAACLLLLLPKRSHQESTPVPQHQEVGRKTPRRMAGQVCTRVIHL